MVLRRIKTLFTGENESKIDNNMSKIEEIQRLRALREHQWDQLIDKIHYLIHKSPFDFKVYLDTNSPNLVMMMRIYEPGDDPVDPAHYDSIAHIYKPKEDSE